MKKPLFDRLTYTYGARAVRRAIDAMLSAGDRSDPLRWLTEDGKQELFERLRTEHRWIRRNNARNRAIHRERTAAQIRN